MTDTIAEKYNATVTGKTDLTDDLFILKVRTDNPILPFISGQYVLLGLSSNISRRSNSLPEFKESKADRLILRAYSIASGGHETETLEFLISVVSNGQLTPRLVQIQVGDRLNVGEKIRGFFTLNAVPQEHSNVVLAATGTGLAPFVSMLREHALQSRPFRFLVIHGVPHSRDLAYKGEMELNSRQLPGVGYVPFVTRPHLDPAWNGRKGRITPLFEGDLMEKEFGIPLDPKKTSVFLCGNPAMVEEVSALLMPLGFAKGEKDSPTSLHTEEYW